MSFAQHQRRSACFALTRAAAAVLLLAKSVGSSCPDDPNFRFQNDDAQDCSWVGSKIGKRCKKEWANAFVRDYCPTSCQVSSEEACCANDHSFRHEGKDDQDCFWAVRTDKCDLALDVGGTVRDRCPLSCDGGCFCQSLWLGSPGGLLSEVAMAAGTVVQQHSGLDDAHRSLAADVTTRTLHTLLDMDGASNRLASVQIDEDSSTAAVTSIGNTGVDKLEKFAIDSNGNMFAMDGEGTRLFTVNKTTGKTCFVADMKTTIVDIVFDGSDRLVAVDDKGRLHVVDTASGALQTLAKPGNKKVRLRLLAADTGGSDKLFGIGYRKGTTGPESVTLYEIVPAGNTYTTRAKLDDAFFSSNGILKPSSAMIYCPPQNP